MEQPFVSEEYYRRPEGQSPQCAVTWSFTVPHPTLSIFCDWIPLQTQMCFPAHDSHAILAAGFPGFFLPT